MCRATPFYVNLFFCFCFAPLKADHTCKLEYITSFLSDCTCCHAANCEIVHNINLKFHLTRALQVKYRKRKKRKIYNAHAFLERLLFLSSGNAWDVHRALNHRLDGDQVNDLECYQIIDLNYLIKFNIS